MIPAGGAAPSDRHSLSRLCVPVMPLMHTVLQLAVYQLGCLSAVDQSIKGSRLSTACPESEPQMAAKSGREAKLG